MWVLPLRRVPEGERGHLVGRACGLAKGSAEPNKTRVGKITLKQVEEIAKIKMPDLNCFSLESAMKSVRGTAPMKLNSAGVRSMRLSPVLLLTISIAPNFKHLRSQPARKWQSF